MPPPLWVPGKLYRRGELVSRYGVLYQATCNVETDDDPAFNGPAWVTPAPITIFSTTLGADGTMSGGGGTGPQGPAGPPGPAGPAGSTGPQGPAGSQGPAGPTGNTGQQGIQGLTGNTGSPGTPGTQGIQGIQGVPGTNGTNWAPVHTILANDTLALAFATNTSVRLTVTANRTLTTTVPAAGRTCRLLVLTAGSSSFTITFGTGFKTTGTLATGTTAARVFVVSFISDGTNLYEMGRTAAMVA